MAKVFKENQSYHDNLSIGLLGVLAAFTIYKIVNGIFTAEIGIPLEVLIGLLTLITVAIIFYKALKLKIRITSDKMTFKINPLPWAHIKVHQSEIESIRFFQVTEAALCSGWAMNFGPRGRIFNFGDKQGMIIEKIGGEQIVVFSKKLFLQKAEIEDKLKAHNWNLANS